MTRQNLTVAENTDLFLLLFNLMPLDNWILPAAIVPEPIYVAQGLELEGFGHGPGKNAGAVYSYLLQSGIRDSS